MIIGEDDDFYNDDGDVDDGNENVNESSLIHV